MKNFLRVFSGEDVNPPPIWLMRQAGRHLPEYRALRKKTSDFLSFCYSRDLATEATLQPIKRYNFDAAILFSDILVIPDGLGQKVKFLEGYGPKLERIRSLEDITTLAFSTLQTSLEPVYEIIRSISEILPNNTTLIGFSAAPWTLASYMVEGDSSRDFQNVRVWAYKSPKDFGILIDKLVDCISSYLIAQIDNGCEAIQIFDTWAGILPPDQFERWVIEPVSKIVVKVKEKHREIPIIGFPKGAGHLYKKFIDETAVDGVSIDSTVDLLWVKQNIQPHCVVQGNLDNMLLLAGGAQLESSVKEILYHLNDGPFIFNLGHGVLPETPVSHVKKLLELVRQR